MTLDERTFVDRTGKKKRLIADRALDILEKADWCQNRTNFTATQRFLLTDTMGLLAGIKNEQILVSQPRLYHNLRELIETLENQPKVGKRSDAAKAIDCLLSITHQVAAGGISTEIDSSSRTKHNSPTL